MGGVQKPLSESSGRGPEVAGPLAPGAAALQGVGMARLGQSGPSGGAGQWKPGWPFLDLVALLKQCVSGAMAGYGLGRAPSGKPRCPSGALVWEMEGGGDRKLAMSAGWHVGKAWRTPVLCYLVCVMRGNSHKENWGAERLRPPLRVKASHRLNPADPGLKVALEPWARSVDSCSPCSLVLL